MNEAGYNFQSDDNAISSGPPNGSTYADGTQSAQQQRTQQYSAQGNDYTDVPSSSSFLRPQNLTRPGNLLPPKGGQFFSEESAGEAALEVFAAESGAESAELNAEMGNPAAQESGAEGVLEATAAQLEAANAESAAESGSAEGLFDVISGIAGSLFETGEVREAGSAVEGQSAPSHEEFFPLFAALIPTLVSAIGPTVAKTLVKSLSPLARQGIKRAASAILPKGGLGRKPAKNMFSMFAKLLESAAAQEGGEATESGAEVGPEVTSLLSEAASTIEVIIGTDDRKKIYNPGGDPWRRICLLRITFPDGQVFRGTGFFIGSRALVTAGHCVYLHDHGGWATKIEVSPGANGAVRPYGSVVSTTFRSVSGWVNNKKPECDYACVVLPTGAFNGRNLGKFGFGVFDGQQLLAKPAVLSGYPGDKPLEMWGMRRRIKTVTSKTLIYDIDTVGGQSGAPVYIKLNGQRFVVGIHNYGNAAGNSATRVTQPVYERMKQWSML
ncbi:trypsin-like serine peptidase [Massilia sp. TSP1-1-2]|uniref:trypsin-like serine peptidase n=1 Tax=unclassified Massilia TaxID=2609279 RepID=UPI003CF061C0